MAKVEGVTSVDNQIEVLPNSYHDDDIRLATVRALFSNAALKRYAWFRYHHIPQRSDIHIIVKNGNITLEGEVARKAHSDLAFLLAHGVSEAFSVTNHLTVQSPVKES